MMINPEQYYEDNLKGKTAQEIRARIRALKARITRIKRKIENADDITQIIMNSNQETQMAYTRSYLERAKQALVEAGETYKPSKTEQKLMHSTQAFVSLTKSDFLSEAILAAMKRNRLLLTRNICIWKAVFPLTRMQWITYKKR